MNHLFVNTQLDTKFEIPPEVDNSSYRELDAEYYAWLRYKMTLAKQALGENSLEWPILRDRFNEIHKWAVEHIGMEKLVQAIKKMTPERAAQYIPSGNTSQPTPHPTRTAARSGGAGVKFSDHLHPSTGGRFTEKVSQTALERVRAIETEALALGWHYDDLYANASQHPMPYCDSWGLIAFLDRKDGQVSTIGKVTLQSIEIILPNGVRQSFYNHRVEQPWLKFVDGGQKKQGGGSRS